MLRTVSLLYSSDSNKNSYQTILKEVRGVTKLQTVVDAGRHALNGMFNFMAGEHQYAFKG